MGEEEEFEIEISGSQGVLLLSVGRYVDRGGAEGKDFQEGKNRGNLNHEGSTANKGSISTQPRSPS